VYDGDFWGARNIVFDGSPNFPDEFDMAFAKLLWSLVRLLIFW